MRTELFCLLLCIMLLPVCVAADEPKGREGTGAKDCLVRVRVLQGLERSAEHAHRPVNAGPMIADLNSQLKKLPFSKYEVLDVKELPVDFGEKGEFHLTGGMKEQYAVSILPLSLANQRVQMTVEWSVPGGESLLSSKLRVENGKNVLFGTDSDSQSSTMICIRLNCQ